jgi:hypothetical protein
MDLNSVHKNGVDVGHPKRILALRYAFRRIVLASVDQPDRLPTLDLDADRLPIERTLGLLWDCENDSFTFKTSTRAEIRTEREVLPVVLKDKVDKEIGRRLGPTPAGVSFVTRTIWAMDLSAFSLLKTPR